jgi:hypothetical protein
MGSGLFSNYITFALIVFSLILFCPINSSVAENISAAPKNSAETSEYVAPKIVLPEETFNFGEVLAGEKVVHEFLIQNEGNRTLQIKSVNAACGCTATLLNSKEIKPSESTTLKITFDTSGFQGNKIKTVRINSNDPIRPTVVATVQGEIKKDIEVEPHRIYFGKVRKGESKKVDVVIKVRGANAQISDVSTKSENLSIEQQDDNDRKKRFAVRLSEKLPVGIFRDWVVIKTTSAKTPVINLPVFARVEGDLTVVPSDISFGLREGPLLEDIFEVVELVNYGDKPISILKIETDDKAITASVEPNPKRKGFIIRVGLKKGTVGTFKGTVEIQTNHEDVDQRIIKVPVYGIVSEKN